MNIQISEEKVLKIRGDKIKMESLGIYLDGHIHTKIHCPKCGAEMVEYEFKRENIGDHFIWDSYRKCSKCDNVIKL